MDRIVSLHTETLTVGRYLLDRLFQLGVEHIFGIPGDYILRFDKMIEEHPIHFINTTRENTAGYMADAYGRQRGLGVACITYGVGINIVNAVALSYTEGVPLVIISGAPSDREYLINPNLHHLINHKKTEERDTTQLEIFKQITVDQAILDNPKTALDAIDRVLLRCLQEKKPVYIELPRDMVESQVTPHATPPISEAKANPVVLAEAIHEVEKILQKCRQPLFWLGRTANPNPLYAFAEKHSIPIVSTLLGKGVVDERSPLYLGVYQGKLSEEAVSQAVASCDTIIEVGVIRSDLATGFQTLHEPKYQITAKESQLSVQHHTFSDISENAFIEALQKTEFTRSYPFPFTPMYERVFPYHTTENKIATKSMLSILQTAISLDHILVADVGDSLFASADLMVGRGNYFSPAYFGTMGYAIPAGVGLAIATPEKRVIALVGDGAFQMNGTELSTAVRYGADPIIILMNNHGYGTERPLLEGEYNNLLNWNYTALPALFGAGHSFRVTTENGFKDALQHALRTRGAFTLIEVDLDSLDFSPALHRFKNLAQVTI